jgi:tRNA A-37 threonylcarbamoyl transferase component Bud32
MELIASGAQADVYLDKGKAIKLFKNDLPKEEIEYEINSQKMAFEYGLPVPEIYDIIVINGKYGIVMEYIEGIPIGKKMLDDQTKTDEYLRESIEIQLKIQSIITDKFPPMKDKLEWKILHAKYIEEATKKKIYQSVSNKPFGKNLCHGDLHVLNLLETKKGIKIIDWVDASSGSRGADVYRTYLLYKTNKPEIAGIYLELYCEISKMAKDEIFEWEPIIAVARLSDNGITKNEIEIIQGIINNPGVLNQCLRIKYHEK